MKDRVINDSVNRITQGYSTNHRGIDLGWRTDESQNRVFPNCKGTVEVTLDNIPNGSEKGGGWGNYVLIKHDNGMYSRYSHLRSGLPVNKGQRVDENTQIGIIGDSGRAFGRHLHFEVQTGASSTSRINPTKYLTQAICEDTPTPQPTGTIAYIQKTLNERYGYNLVVDNIAGKDTWKHLRKALQHELNVQFNAGLVEDGILGVNSQRALSGLIVAYGARGNITWLIQSCLNIKGYGTNGIDSIFGQGTKNAVMSFQGNNGLLKDGKVGRQTFIKLFN